MLDCLKGRVVCGTVCGDMNLIFPEIHRKSRVLYPGSGFLSNSTWPSLPKKNTHHYGLIIWMGEGVWKSVPVYKCDQLLRTTHMYFSNKL